MPVKCIYGAFDLRSDLKKLLHEVENKYLYQLKITVSDFVGAKFYSLLFLVSVKLIC